MIVTVGIPFEAEYHSICERCGGRITPDQRIIRIDEGTGYIHHPRCP